MASESDNSLSDQADRPRHYGLLLMLISVVGLGLRAVFAAQRSFGGDEAGSIDALRMSYHDLLTRFGGWQTMNFYLAGLKWLAGHVGGNSWILVLPSLIAGVALIPLSAGLARRMVSGRTALVAAWLVAINPFLITFSVTIRSYAILAALTTGAVVVWLAWCDRPRWSVGWLCALLLALALVAHLNGGYCIGVLGILTVARLWRWHGAMPLREVARRAATLGVPTVLLVSAVGAAYYPQWETIREFRGIWSDVAPTWVDYIPTVYGMFMGQGYVVPLTLAVIGYAVWRGIRRGLPTQLLLAFLILQVLLMSLAGVSHTDRAFARFDIALLPLLLILLADGLVALPRRCMTWGAVAVVSICFVQGFVRLNVGKAEVPWRSVVADIAGQQNIDAIFAVDNGGAATSVNANAPGMVRFINAQGLVAADAPAGRGLRVLVIDGEGRLNSTRGFRAFGKIRVALYEAAAGREVARLILDDLDASLRRKAFGQYVGYFQAGCELAEALELKDAYATWRELYWKSMVRSPGVRMGPSSRYDWPTGR